MIEILKPDFEFSDDRGKLTQLVHQGFSQVNVIYSRAGSFRGGHYHKQNCEAFYIINGELELTVSLGDTVESYTFKSEDMFLIPENIVHSFRFSTDTLLVSMYNNGLEQAGGTKDIFTV